MSDMENPNNPIDSVDQPLDEQNGQPPEAVLCSQHPPAPPPPAHPPEDPLRMDERLERLGGNPPRPLPRKNSRGCKKPDRCISTRVDVSAPPAATRPRLVCRCGSAAPGIVSL